MRFEAGSRRARPKEAVVPMINVVFLLLIFFLMTAVVANPPPFEMTLPDAEAREDASVGDALYIGPTGDLAYEKARGEAVFGAISAREGQAPLSIRADQGAPAARLAEVLARLTALGIGDAELSTVRR